MASKKLVDYFKDEEMRVEDLDLDPKDTFPIICLSDSDQENETKSESRVTSSCSTELIEKKRQLFHKGKIVKYLMVNGKRTPIRVSPIKAKDCVRPTSLRHFINNKRFMSHWLNSWRILQIICSKYKVSYSFITHEMSDRELNTYVLAIPALQIYISVEDFDIIEAKKYLIKELHRSYVKKLF